jgi:hypothetical protein
MKCFLTVYEQLTWPRAMAEQCVRLGLEPVILDNASTYPPLLEWLEHCPYEVIRVGSNAGCYGFFHAHRHLEQTEPYILSDSDLDLTGVPDDCVQRLIFALAKNPSVCKAGLSLEIGDLPPNALFRSEILKAESKFWVWRAPGGAWHAQIGATFALYDPARNHILTDDIYQGGFYSAVRLDRPYTARHLPWYLNESNLSEELLYYFSRCDNVAFYGSKIKLLLQARDAARNLGDGI